MARAIEHDWYLAEWLAAVELEPKDLREKAGWSKRKMSELINGQMRYNKHVLNEAACVMNIKPYELLMHPSDAMELRQLQHAAGVFLRAGERRAAARKDDPGVIPDDDDNAMPAKRSRQ